MKTIHNALEESISDIQFPIIIECNVCQSKHEIDKEDLHTTKSFYLPGIAATMTPPRIVPPGFAFKCPVCKNEQKVNNLLFGTFQKEQITDPDIEKGLFMPNPAVKKFLTWLMYIISSLVAIGLVVWKIFF